MAIYGESLTIQYVAWDTVNNVPKTGDASNHTLRWVKDGTAAAPTNAPSELDAANAPGLYKLTLTATETQCWVGTLCGKSSTSGVVVMPITLTFERLPTAAPGDTNGLPIIGSDPLTKLDVNVSTRLATLAYTAPDNASIGAIKTQTDKLTFDGSNNVYAVATVDVDENAIASAVASQISGMSVVVQPLTARALISAGDGGLLKIDRYERLIGSWLILNADLSGHDLRLIVYTSTATKVAEYSGAEVTIAYQTPNSVVTVNGPDTKTPAPGTYLWKLADQTLDRVLLRGKLVVLNAPDAD